MNRYAVVLATLLGASVVAQQPPAPPGGVKPKPPTSERKRVRERAEDMRRNIEEGKQVKSHVRVQVRLKNGNRLTGVVKDGRLVERVDGLRFVDADARDDGAGIRLWYSAGTRSYVFVPFGSLRSYKVVQRLSQKQILEIEKEMRMAEELAAERAARAARKARAGDKGAEPQGERPAAIDPKQPPQLGGNKQPVPTPGGDVQPAKNSPPKLPKSGAGDAGNDIEKTKQQLRYSELLRKYPPTEGWNKDKRDEISRRFNVLGVRPSKFELEFVEVFSEWQKACQELDVDPNAGSKEPEPERRRSRRGRR